MFRTRLAHNLGLLLSAAAFISFLGRAFLDFRYVLPEFGVEMPDLIPVLALYLAVSAGWVWALLGIARGSRAGLVTGAVFNALLLVFGISTMTTFCPLPCATAYPLSDILIAANVLLGITALLVSANDLRGFAPSRAVASDPTR
ncbi:MAG: hypothetical protein Kow0077_15410 [Anaerolineae bacterium]